MLTRSAMKFTNFDKVLNIRNVPLASLACVINTCNSLTQRATARNLHEFLPTRSWRISTSQSLPSGYIPLNLPSKGDLAPCFKENAIALRARGQSHPLERVYRGVFIVENFTIAPWSVPPGSRPGSFGSCPGKLRSIPGRLRTRSETSRSIPGRLIPVPGSSISCPGTLGDSPGSIINLLLTPGHLRGFPPSTRREGGVRRGGRG